MHTSAFLLFFASIIGLVQSNDFYVPFSDIFWDEKTPLLREHRKAIATRFSKEYTKLLYSCMREVEAYEYMSNSKDFYKTRNPNKVFHTDYSVSSATPEPVARVANGAAYKTEVFKNRTNYVEFGCAYKTSLSRRPEGKLWTTQRIVCIFSEW